MSEPRTAALAEALRSTGLFYPEHSERDAAAILAALDAAGWTLVIERDWVPVHKAVMSIVATKNEAVAPLNAEIARLRRIDEAARATDAFLIDGTEPCWVCGAYHGEEPHAEDCVAAALRAELEAGKRDLLAPPRRSGAGLVSAAADLFSDSRVVDDPLVREEMRRIASQLKEDR